MDTHDADHQDAGVDELDHVPQPGGRLTGATVATVRDKLMSDGTLFRVDEEGLARHFTQSFFSGNAWQVSLRVLRDVVKRLDGCPNDIPKDPREFPEWVRRELLEFEHLPKATLAQLYEDASSDLAATHLNVERCQRAIAEIERRTPKTDSDEIDVRFFRYYQQTNEAARSEIVDVLAQRIKREAIRAAYGPLFPLDVVVPWSFRWNPASFSPETFSPVRHAFIDLPIRQRRKVEEAYLRDDKTEFDSQLAYYVRDKRPVEHLRSMLNEHHLLSVRRQVIVPALEAYERGELALFASAVAVQIEGIFEDACQLAGVPFDQLRMNTLTPKLDALAREAPVRLDYVYYAFKFPIVRNRVAHGRALGADLPRTAGLLLLDLRDACRVVRQLPVASNALVEVLRTAPAQPRVDEVVRFAVLHAETNGEPPDAFYGLTAPFDAMKVALEDGPVWDFLRSLLGAEYDDVDAGLRFLAERLKKIRPALRKECSELQRRLQSRGKGPFDRERFFAAIEAGPRYQGPATRLQGGRASLLGLLCTPMRRLLGLLGQKVESG